MRHIAAVLLLGLALAGRIQADAGDPPERVAVIDLVDGAAAAQPAGVGDWVADLANRPLTSGDKLWVDDNSRAELHLGSSAIRLGADTGVQFLNVGDRVAQLRLSAGSMNVRLRYLSPDETFEVDTPNSAVSLLQAGEYRIDVDDTGTTVAVSVWRGQAEVAGQAQSFTLDAQQRGAFQGTDTLAVQFGDLPPADALDQWVQDLDQREDLSLTANFLSRDVSGYADLDGSGDWQTDPDYGPVWFPPVTGGWVPYSTGSWLWIAPWGWTWVAAEPWGFAPFHYGRWVHVRSRWAWSPGQLAVRPVYAPALVGWGSGPGGEVTWVALGYNEIYRPSARVSSAYLQRVNVTNTYIDNTVILGNKPVAAAPHYANLAVPGALLAVTADTFTSARPVSRELVPIAAAQVIMKPGNTIAPTTHSLVRAAGSPGAARGAVPVPPQAIFNRALVARSVPPAGARGATAEPHRLILTTVPKAQAQLRSYSAPQGFAPRQEVASPDRPATTLSPVRPAPGGRDLQSSQEVRPPRPVPHEAVVPADRPAVMPRPVEHTAAPAAPAGEDAARAAAERAMSAPVYEHPAPAPAQAPPAPATRKETLPVHKSSPEKNPQ
jgi:hypothetical protein